MSLTLADIERWDTHDVRDVAKALSSTAGNMDETKNGIKRLPHNNTWSGQAAVAADQSMDKLGAYLATHAEAQQAAAKVFTKSADDIDDVQKQLRDIKSFAEDKQFSIDMTTGEVTAESEDASDEDRDHIASVLQQILSQGEDVDAELAHGVNLLDGVDQPDSSPAVPLDPHSERARNQEQAFEKVYGHKPITANDWRMAAALDPHSYDPKYHGVPPEIVAGRITPQPGKGVVRSNMFIPTDHVYNVPKDLTDLRDRRLRPDNVGDNRGPNANADIDASRVSVFIDYDHGLVVVRQNPTSAVDGQRGGAAAAVPDVHVAQASDGRVTIDYNAHDAYEWSVATNAGATVNGRITFAPHADGTVGLGGSTTVYPSMETYQYRDGAAPAQLQWTPANSGGPWGPGTSLERHHWVGDTSIPAVRPDMPRWKWELENAMPHRWPTFPQGPLPWGPLFPDPFHSHTTQLADPFQGNIPTVAVGR